MCLVKVIVGSWVRLHGMASGGGTVDGTAGGQGLKVQVEKNIVEMEVPKRWFLRKSEGLGPEQSVIIESGYLGNRCDSYTSAVCFRVAGRH